MTVMCNEVFAHQISLFSQHFAQTDSLSKADGDCLDGFLQKKDPILIQLACVQVLFGLCWSVIIPARYY